MSVIAPLRGGRFFSELTFRWGLILLFGLTFALKLPVVQKPPPKKTKLLPAALQDVFGCLRSLTQRHATGPVTGAFSLLERIHLRKALLGRVRLLTVRLIAGLIHGSGSFCLASLVCVGLLPVLTYRF